jgi:hypothetical protein
VKKKNRPKDGSRIPIDAGAGVPRVPIPRRKKRTRRVRLKKGPWTGGPPFGREFFGQTLGGMVEACPCPKGTAPVVHVLLGDGTVLDIAGVVQLFERYAVVAAFEGVGQDGVERTADDIGFEAFPYDLVVRASVRAVPARPHGFGFGQFAAKKPIADLAKPGSPAS